MKRSVTEMVFMLLLLTLFVGCSFVTIERCASFYQRMLREQRQDDQVQLPYLVLFNRLQGRPRRSGARAADRRSGVSHDPGRN